MQLGFSMPLDARRCLMHHAALSSWVHHTYDDLLAAIESGTIPFAFDLRTPGRDRAALRLWHPNVEALVKSACKESGPVPALDELLQLLVPGRFDVRSSDLERYWSISHQHVWELITAGCLPVSCGATAVAGPHSFCTLSSEGLRSFLRSRLLGHAASRNPGSGIRHPASAT